MTKDETLAFLASGQKVEYEVGEGRIQKATLSEWVIEEHRAYASEKGFPYLDSVRDYIMARHGLQISEEDKGRLKTLVYNASHEIRKRDDAAAGWVKPSLEWLDAHEDQYVEVMGESLLGSTTKTAKVRRVGGQIYVMPQGARKRCYDVHSVMVRELKEGTNGHSVG